MKPVQTHRAARPSKQLVEAIRINNVSAAEAAYALVWKPDPKTLASSHSPLHLAAELGHVECLRWLISKGWDVDGIDNEGLTPLLSAVYSTQPSTTEALIEAGAHFDEPNFSLQTPLILAAIHQHNGCAAVLLSAGADPGRRDKDGHDALYYASSRGNTYLKSLIISTQEARALSQDHPLTPTQARSKPPRI